MGIKDKVTDGIASVISGKKIQTVVVSFDEILERLETVLNNVDLTEIKDIEKVIKGKFWSSLSLYDTNNGKYRVSTLYALTSHSNRVMNEISVMDLESGKIYTYKVFLFKRKFKKAAKQLINQYKDGRKVINTAEEISTNFNPKIGDEKSESLPDGENNKKSKRGRRHQKE